MKNTAKILQHLTDIDPDNFEVELDDEFLSSLHIGTEESGLTLTHPQDMDEARIDEVLVEDSFNEQHYPTIQDIADPEAVEESYRH
ncbi:MULTISPECIES: hypothetical protein [unclassified Moraxella]|uniref:hypothetical protein n=1 Tax=unclassified Moraxella TaxID=2685852 RepID=UPI003AF5D087